MNLTYLMVQHCAMYRCRTVPFICRLSSSDRWFHLCEPCYLFLEKWGPA